MYPKYGSKQANTLRSLYNLYESGEITFDYFKEESRKFVRKCKCDCSDCGGKRWKGNCIIERVDYLKDELLIQGYEKQKIMSGLRGSTSSLSSNSSSVRVSLV
jgi:hypothetical protein